MKQLTHLHGQDRFEMKNAFGGRCNTQDIVKLSSQAAPPAYALVN
jgi:hypothetical protein